jgi:hypothetical protein
MRDDDVLFDGDRSDALPAVAHDADLVEVSDADILMIEGEPSDPGKSIGGPSAEHQSGTRSRVFNDTTERIDREARDQVVLPESKKADRTSTPGLASRLLNPPVLAGVLGIGVLLIVTVLWVLLGAEENLEQRKFSVKDLQVELIQGPGPTPYLSDEKSVRHYGRGNRFAYLGQFELAIEEYRKASQLDSANPLPQRALGVMYAAMGQTRLSIEAYRAYLKMAPHSADAPLVRKIVKQASLGKSD